MQTTDIPGRQLASRVIAIARERYGKGAAAFDYWISVAARGRDVGGADLELRNAVYIVATGWPDTSGRDAHQREKLAADLADELAAELAAYRQRCGERRYGGWSNGGPIHYLPPEHGKARQ